MKYGRQRKRTDRARLALCTAHKKRGGACGNKACTNTRLCHVHTPGRAIKKRTARPLLVHLFYLYGMMNVQMEGIEAHWKWMTERVFGGVVDRAYLQSHDNRYRRYVEKHGLTRADVALEAMYARKRARGAVHRYEEFNLDNLAEHIQMRSVVEVYGVPYQFTPAGPRRCDAVGHAIPQDFCSTFALNGYAYQDGVWCLHPTLERDGLTAVQGRCIARVFDFDRAPPAGVKAEPVEEAAASPQSRALLDVLAHAWFLHGLATSPDADAVQWMWDHVFKGLVDVETLREHAGRYAAWRAYHHADPVFDTFRLPGATRFVHRCTPYEVTAQGVVRTDVAVKPSFVHMYAMAGYVWRDDEWLLHPQLDERDVPPLQLRCQGVLFRLGLSARPPQNGA